MSNTRLQPSADSSNRLRHYLNITNSDLGSPPASIRLPVSYAVLSEDNGQNSNSAQSHPISNSSTFTLPIRPCPTTFHNPPQPQPQHPPLPPPRRQPSPKHFIKTSIIKLHLLKLAIRNSRLANLRRESWERYIRGDDRWGEDDEIDEWD